jgi:hypothetical protein
LGKRIQRFLRRPLVAWGMLAFPILSLVIGIAVVLILQRTLLSPTAQAAPDQPIDFPHTIHAGELNLDCTFCHRTAATEPQAGLPALEQCMFCHEVVQPEASTQIPLLLEAWNNYEDVDWNRVHQVPDHVQFVHEAHINAGVECSTCHGDVQEMEKIKQVRDLRMDDCVQCHLANEAPIDCTTCHY